MNISEIIKTISWKAVESSNLKSVAWHRQSQTLFVEFNYGNRRYAYLDVSKDEYRSVLTASSIGKAFNTNIKQCKECLPLN